MTPEEVVDAINALVEENKRLREQIRTDRLTGIYNQRALEEAMAESRYEGWLVFVDLNGLKRVNDELGHRAGDEVIIEFGVWLRMTTRAARDKVRCDAIAIRAHGDEFLVWTTNKRAARAIRDRVRRWRSQNGVTTASAGIGRDKHSADAAMYIDKQHRRGNREIHRKHSA